MASTVYTQKMADKLGNDGLLKVGLRLPVVGSIGLLAVSYFYPYSPLIFSVLVALFISGAAQILPSSVSKAMEMAHQNKGVAASIMSSTRLGMAFLGSFVGGLISDKNFIMAAVYMNLLVLLAILLLVTLKRDNQPKEINL